MILFCHLLMFFFLLSVTIAHPTVGHAHHITKGPPAFGHSVNYAPHKQWGKYELMTPDDQILLVTYTADENGFRPELTYLKDKEELTAVLSTLPSPSEFPYNDQSLPQPLINFGKNIDAPDDLYIPKYPDFKVHVGGGYDFSDFPDTPYEDPPMINDEPYFHDLISDNIDPIDPNLQYNQQHTVQYNPTPKWDSQRVIEFEEQPKDIPFGYRLGGDIEIRQPVDVDKINTIMQYQIYPTREPYFSSTFKPLFTTSTPDMQQYINNFPQNIPGRFGERLTEPTKAAPSRNNGEPYFESDDSDTLIKDAMKNNFDKILFSEKNDNNETKIDPSTSTKTGDIKEKISNRPELPPSLQSEDMESDDEDDSSDSSEEITEATTSSSSEDTTESSLTTILPNEDYIDLDDDADGSIPTTIPPEMDDELEETTTVNSVDFFFEGNSTDMSFVEEVTTLEPEDITTIVPQRISGNPDVELLFDTNIQENITVLLDRLRTLGMSKNTEEKIMKLSSKHTLSNQLQLMAKLADFLSKQNPGALENILNRTNDTMFDPSGEVMMIIPTNGANQFVALSVFPREEIVEKSSSNSVR